MKRILTIAIVVYIVVNMFTPTLSVSAASEITVQVSETQLNDLVRSAGPIPGISDMSFEIQEGRLALFGTIHEEGFPPARVIIGILVSIDNGQLVWTVMGVSVNGQYVSPEQLADFNRSNLVTPAINGVLRVFVAKYGANLYFTSIMLSNHTITLHFTPGGPPASAPASASAPSGKPLTDCIVTTTADLKLRSEANLRGTMVTVVPAGTRLAATARQGSWLYVNFQGNQGWLNAGFLKKAGTCG